MPNISLNNLTIISITYNNPSDLMRTFESVKKYLQIGAKWIVVNGGSISLNCEIRSHCSNFIEEPDKGRYDAINKGINLVNTKFFLLVHSGDELLIDIDSMRKIIEKMENRNLDLMLGNQYIALYKKLRKHTITFWRPWMLSFGAQPPHMPIIYKKEFVCNLSYKHSSNIIADHIYLSSIFNKEPNWDKSPLYHIKMGEGGATTNGLKSFFIVSIEFIKEYGILKGLIMSISRIPFKILQMF